MMELKGILLAAIGEHPEMSEEERGDLLGECDLIMSFLCYNDISAMSRLHRSASAQMSRQAISIRNSGGWTFGSPSVLMMFYRAPGELASELAEMDECMPHYYRITDGHGQGAETIMRAEAAVLPGTLHRCPYRIGARLCPDRGTTGRRIWRSAAIFWRGGFLSARRWSRS